MLFDAFPHLGRARWAWGRRWCRWRWRGWSRGPWRTQLPRSKGCPGNALACLSTEKKIVLKKLQIRVVFNDHTTWLPETYLIFEKKRKTKYVNTVEFMKRVCSVYNFFISSLIIYPSAHNKLSEHFSWNQLYNA